ncbi:MAG: hypothetical protein AAF725_24030, partial [Acidobacteriota bacterium]
IETRLDASGTTQGEADVAAASATGDFVAVWQSQDSDGSGVFGRRFDSGGMPIGIEFQVNERTTLEQGSPEIAALEGGGFAAVWTDEESIGSFVRALRLFDSGGMPIGIETQFGSSDIAAKAPALAVSSTGTLLVAWPQASDRIATQLFDAGGMPIGIETLISGEAAAGGPGVAPTRDGGFVVVWENSSGQDTDGTGIFTRRIDSIGMPIGIETQVNGKFVGDQKSPSIAAAPDGTFAVAWQSPDSDGSGIFVHRLDAGGMPIGIETLHSQTQKGDQQAADLVFTSSEGGFQVVWQSDDAGDEDILVSPSPVLLRDDFESGGLEAWDRVVPSP